jgi:hypothetical protein
MGRPGGRSGLIGFHAVSMAPNPRREYLRVGANALRKPKRRHAAAHQQDPGNFSMEPRPSRLIFGPSAPCRRNSTGLRCGRRARTLVLFFPSKHHEPEHPQHRHYRPR